MDEEARLVNGPAPEPDAADPEPSLQTPGADEPSFAAEPPAPEPVEAPAEPPQTPEADGALTDAAQAAEAGGAAPAPGPAQDGCAYGQDDGQRGRRRAAWRRFGEGWLYFAIYAAAQLVVTIPAVALLAMRVILEYGYDRPDLYMDAVLEAISAYMIPLSIASTLLALLTICILFRAKGKRFFREAGFARMRAAGLPAILVLGPCLNAAVASLLALLPGDMLQAYSDAAEMLIGDMKPLTVVYAVLGAPVFEEIIFRGLMYRRFAGAMPGAVAALLSSFVFGLMHQQPLWIAYTFVLGVLLCTVMDWYGSLWAPILLHLSFNAGSLLTAPLAELPALPVCAVSLALAATALVWTRHAARSARVRPAAGGFRPLTGEDLFRIK